jgi:hypothetical protein
VCDPFILPVDGSVKRPGSDHLPLPERCTLAALGSSTSSGRACVIDPLLLGRLQLLQDGKAFRSCRAQG